LVKRPQSLFFFWFNEEQITTENRSKALETGSEVEDIDLNTYDDLALFLFFSMAEDLMSKRERTFLLKKQRRDRA
jgi:hypothetical protein